MSSPTYVPRCGRCKAPASKVTLSGLLRCQTCYDDIGLCRLPKGADDLAVREHQPGVPVELTTRAQPFASLRRLASDFKLRQAGDDAA